MKKPIIPSSFITKHVTFYHLHFLYFTSLSLLGALVLGSHSTISFIDALYNSVSALTVTGLLTVEMHRFSLLDDITLLILMILGSHVFTSLIPLFLRRYSAHIQERSGRSIPRFMYDEYLGSVMAFSESKSVDMTPSDGATQTTNFSMDVHELPNIATVNVTVSEANQGTVPYYEFWDREKELLALFQKRNPVGEALGTLGCIVTLYFIGIQIVGFIVCEMFFLTNREALSVLEKNKKNHIFFSFFTSVTAFANAGFTLIDANMVPFQKSVILLLCLSVLILVGNTMFAPCLRLIIWLLHRYARGRKKTVYKYLLQNPRKCFTHLFSYKQTIWLMVSVLMLNTAQMVCIYGLDWRSRAFDGLGAGYKIVDGVFQSVTTRNAGMNVISLSSLSAPTLFLIVGMMYIAVYPVSITRQYSQETDEEGGKSLKKFHENNIYLLSRRLLAGDSVFLFIATFIICLSERNQIRQDPLNFSVFNMIFEIVSAYGNVGLSMGYSCGLRRSSSGATSCEDVTYSLSGKWTTEGKLLLIVIMLLGRSRGLPHSVDAAIRLPIYKQPLEEINARNEGHRSNNTSRDVSSVVEMTAQKAEGSVHADEVDMIIVDDDASSISGLVEGEASPRRG